MLDAYLLPNLRLSQCRPIILRNSQDKRCFKLTSFFSSVKVITLIYRLQGRHHFSSMRDESLHDLCGPVWCGRHQMWCCYEIHGAIAYLMIFYFHRMEIGMATEIDLGVRLAVYVIKWASYQIRKIAGCACAGMPGTFFTSTEFKENR